MRGDQPRERIEHRLDFTALQLECRLIDDQTCTDGHDLLDHAQPVCLERIAGRYEVDNRVGETYQRGEFHRSVQVDEVDMDALRGEVLACRADVLGRDAQPGALAYRAVVIELLRHRNDHAALGDAEI